MKIHVKQLLKSPLFIFLLASIIPFIFAFFSIYYGRIAFWFDPARDLLLALGNLSHPTFVGQPTGLPGIHYPPYWIWFISLILIFSKNPQIVSFFLLTIPYFTIFPFFLYKIVGKWGVLIFGALWFLFISNFTGYSTQIWNVNLFPLFLIISIYYTLETYKAEKNKLKMLYALLSGFFLGLSSSFHLSLGIPVVLGIVTFHLILLIPRQRPSFARLRNSIINLILFFLGLFLAYTPSLFFELRHNFLQIKTFLNAIADTAFYNSAVVGQTGLSHDEIVKHFLGRAETYLSIPITIISVFIFFILIEFLFRVYKKKLKVDMSEGRIILLCLLIFFWVIYIFLKNNNPVWEYYFSGLEILFLLIFGFLASKTAVGKILLIIAVFLTVLISFHSSGNNLKKNNFSVTDLATEKHMINLINSDAAGDFYYYAYNPAIYTNEYDYLFRTIDADKLNVNSDNLYIIIPKTSNSIKEDFIHYRAPQAEFRQIREWNIPDGTTIYKMQRIKNP